MSSYTVSIDSDSSVLRSQIFPAIDLDGHKQWEAALLDFTTYNSIPNVTENINNELHYYHTEKDKTNGANLKVIKLPTGSYEIEDINRKFQEYIGKDNIEIKANNNLLKCEVKSKFYLDFSKHKSIGSLLGFSAKSTILEPNKKHIGNEKVNIIKVNTINITCNIIHGSYKNGENKHILHTFYPTVPVGFKIVEKPHNLIYLPLNTSRISDIELNVTDQDGKLVDFREEIISIRLHIKSF